MTRGWSAFRQGAAARYRGDVRDGRAPSLPNVDDEFCCYGTLSTEISLDDTLHAWCSGQEYALAEEVWFRSSVLRGLELLDAVDGALDRAGVVFQGEAGDHGVQVAAQSGGE